ncbi:hypothetical protein TNCV_3426831 [Trichonephila clavipes]|nr:hypothetical protein TNCV_3426831 [Trichonephila clavipes]
MQLASRGLPTSALGELDTSRLNGRRAASPLVRLVEGEERCETANPLGCSPSKLDETELNWSVTSMVLKATANDRRHLALRPDEFHGP